MARKKFIRILVCAAILIMGCPTIFAKTREVLQEQENEAVKSSKIWKLDSYNQAISQFERTAADWENLGDIQKAVFCLIEAAKLAQITSDYKTAFRALDKAIKLSTGNNLTSEKTISLSLYALISRQKGETDNSRKYSAEALQSSEQTDSPLAKGYANFSAGMHEYSYGKMEQTKELFEKAAFFAQQTSEIELINQVLLFKGYVLGRDGNAVEGLKSIELALQKSTDADYQRGKAVSYFGLAFLNMLLNEKQKAIGFFQKSEELFPKDFEWLERARLYTSFAAICQEYGELELNEIYLEKALSFYRKAEYPLGELAVLPSIAKVKFLKGDLEGARTIYEQTINFAREYKNDFHIGIGTEGLADLNLKTENYDGAIKHYQEALKIYQEIGINLPRVENNLGKAFEKKGDYRAAKPFYNQALQLNTQTKDHLPASENLFNLAKLNFQEGNVETSLEQIEKSLEITESLYSDVANGILKRSYFSSVYDRYEFYIHLLMQKHKKSPGSNFEVQALQANEKLRSRSLLETLRLSEAKFVRDANPALVEKENNLRKLISLKADKLTGLLSRKADPEEKKKAEDELRSLENDLENVKAELKQFSPIYSTVKNPPPFEVNEFQQNILDEKTVLLEFALGEKESYLWLVSKNEVSVFTLPARALIEKRVDKILQTFENRFLKSGEEINDYQTRLADLDNIFNQEAKLLSSDLLGQIADKIKNKRLLIVPDGKLHYLPLSALPAPDADELLISQNEIIYEPSASTLNLLTKTSFFAKVPNKDLLVIADPVFSPDDSRLAGKISGETSFSKVLGLNIRDYRLIDSNGNIPRLFASKDEANSIIGTLGNSRTTEAIGYEANRERVLSDEVSDYRILHFATHGLIDVQRPEVSGIVLSQFDETGNSREGFLRLQDIYAMNLAADLVVLSACQSGVGKEVKGEGLMSLNNAFLQAGTKSVLSSAWKVDDNATAELMKLFYANLFNKGLTASESLRQAQISLSKTNQFKSPFYWAAFTIQGEFRQPIKFSPNYWNYLFFALGAVIFGLILWRLKFKKN